MSDRRNDDRRNGRFPLREVRRRFQDRAILVGADLPGRGWSLEEDLAELARLVETAGADIAAIVTQRMERPNPRTFIGAGKAEDVSRLAKRTDATLVVFDDDLTPSQQANLEGMISGVKLIDRTALILDIFALHATSREGKLQVELAQMEYLLPRLRGLWRHLEKTGGGAMGAMGTGGVGTRGPGETQLETDRRLARRRIQVLRKELARVSQDRELQRKRRRRTGVFRVALVGYTNSGKSTLLRALTGADVLVADQLFATLDATTRVLELSEGRHVTVTDTVGFIGNLPHQLVEAFKSTLDEVREADLLLHVVDSTASNRPEQKAAVLEVLGELDAASRPRVEVYNKIDALDDRQLAWLRQRRPAAEFVSAEKGTGLDKLKERVGREAARGAVTMDVLVPYTRGDLVTELHEHTNIVVEEHTPEGTHVTAQVPEEIADHFTEFETERRGG